MAMAMIEKKQDLKEVPGMSIYISQVLFTDSLHKILVLYDSMDEFRGHYAK